MRIMIDLDNTLADYTGALRDFLHMRRPGGIDPDGYTMGEPGEYELWRDPDWPLRTWDEQASVHRDAVAHGLYLNERPYPHAMRTLFDLLCAGHELVIATSRTDDPRFCQTMRWLDRHWHDPAHGPVDYGIAFHFGDKTLLDVDIAFEDDPCAIERLTAKNITVIHPDHPYCRNLTGTVMHDWGEAAGTIGQLQTDKTDKDDNQP